MKKKDFFSSFLSKNHCLRTFGMMSIMIIFITSCSFSENFYDTESTYKTVESVKHESIYFRKDDYRLHSLLLIPETPLNRFVILIQGKGGNSSDWSKSAISLVEEGYHVWLPDYPGHGLSEGTANHSTVLDAVSHMMAEILKYREYESFPKVIWTFSLGTNLAVKLAKEHEKEIEGLIIDGGCTSFEDVAVSFSEAGKFWVKLAVSSPYPAKTNIGYLKDIKLLSIHSKDDKVMPIRMGRELYNLANCEKTFWETDGAHCEAINLYTEFYLKQFDKIFSD